MEAIQLLDWQVWLLGLIASLLVSLLAWLIETALPAIVKLFPNAKPIQPKLGRWIKTVLVMLVAGALAWWWFPTTWPAFPTQWAGGFWDKIGLFFTWVGDALPSIRNYAGASFALYNLLLSYLVDKDRRTKILEALSRWLLPNRPLG